MSAPALLSLWRPSACLKVSGADAANFLQGQFSNDLREISARGGSVYGLWLDHKGKVQGDSFVVTAGGSSPEFLLVSYGTPAEILLSRLDAFLVADEVEIEDQTAGRWGSTWQTSPDSDLTAARPFPQDLVFSGRRGIEGAREIISDLAPPGDWTPQLTADELELRRILAGIPSVPRDVGPEDLPQEARLELEAVAFDKGCYLGQEVMARLHSMGQVRRRLLRVAGHGPAPDGRSPLLQQGKAFGDLRSAKAQDGGWIGLAMLRLTGLQRDEPLSISEAGGRAVQILSQI